MNQKQKTYVIDTSVLIKDPDIFYKLGKSQIVIPTAVIRELDGLKNSSNSATASSARRIARTLDKLGSGQNIASGAKTTSGAIVFICNRYQTVYDLASISDNKIVGCALKLKEEAGTNLTVLTTDGNMRNVARAHGLRAEPYPFLQNDIHAETEVASSKFFYWNIITALIVAVLVLYIVIHNTPWP